MITSFTLSTIFHPAFSNQRSAFRLLEGGRFEPGDFVPCAIIEDEIARIHYFRWSGNSNTYSNSSELPNLLPIEHLAALSEEEWLRLPKCLVPMDYFEVKTNIFGTASQSKVRHKQKDNFCVAGIWRSRLQSDGTTINQLYLITTPVPGGMQVGGRRVPLVIPESQQNDWLHNTLEINRLMNGSVNYLTQQFSVQKIQELVMEPAQELLHRPAA